MLLLLSHLPTLQISADPPLFLKMGVSCLVARQTDDYQALIQPIRNTKIPANWIELGQMAYAI